MSLDPRQGQHFGHGIGGQGQGDRGGRDSHRAHHDLDERLPALFRLLSFLLAAFSPGAAAWGEASALILVFLRMVACTKAPVAARAPVHPGRVTCGDAAPDAGTSLCGRSANSQLATRKCPAGRKHLLRSPSDPAAILYVGGLMGWG